MSRLMMREIVKKFGFFRGSGNQVHFSLIKKV